MYNTNTQTNTYTVVDIRRSFEGFNADLRMIAIRTGKRTTTEIESFIFDIMAWAENKHLKSIDITLVDSANKPIKATRYTIDENGNATQSERAGNNDWPNLPNTILTILLTHKASWNNMTLEEKEAFKQLYSLKNNWTTSHIDNRYGHLTKENAQLYASKGYELKKENYK
jgi:hypothetical protein